MSFSAIDKCIARSAKLQCNVRVGLIKMGKKLGGCSGKGGLLKKKYQKPTPAGSPNNFCESHVWFCLKENIFYVIMLYIYDISIKFFWSEVKI